jgi:hypothetical protein
MAEDYIAGGQDNWPCPDDGGITRWSHQSRYASPRCAGIRSAELT